MINRERARKAAVALAIAASLVWGIWIIAVPMSVVTGKIEEKFAKGPLRVEFEGLGKGLFYSIKADGLSVLTVRDGTRVLYLENFRAGLSIWSLFRFSPSVDFSATLAGGGINGRTGSDGDLILRAEGVDLAAMGLDQSVTGLKAGGIGELNVNVADGKGEARFNVTGIDFLPYKYMGFPMPLNLLKRARGLVLIDNGVARVESAAFDGEGIYARLKGTAGGGKVDMRLELMPSEQVEATQAYFRILQRYRVTAGFYDIPIRTSY